MNKKILILGLGTLCAVSMAQADAVLLSDSFDSSTVNADGNIKVSEISTMGAVGAGAWEAGSASRWGIGSGSATNASGGTAADNEGALARAVDISSNTDSSLNKINLKMNFSTANASETLYVFLRGYVTVSTPGVNQTLGNLGSSNGNVWEGNASTLTDYNLNTGDEYTSSAQGVAAAGIQLSSGTTGAQSVDLTFDMSGYAVSDITGYDYLGVFISRNSAGATPMATINDITVTAIPEPATLGLISAFGMGILFVRRRFMI